MSSGEWLLSLEQFGTNRPPDDWLRQHESAIRVDIAHDLYYPPELRNAFDLLVKLVHIFVVEFFHPTEWEPVLTDALLQAQELQDRPTMTRVYAELGAAYYAMGRNKRALSAFEITLDRARTHELEKMELAAYIGLIRVQATNLSADFEPDLFTRALERSQQGTHDETKAALYQALALVYINRWQLTEGLNWARRAFYLWRTLGDDMEIAKTCYLLAVGNRMAKRFDRAKNWVDRAESYFKFVPYALKNILVWNERGTIFYEQDMYQSAAYWLELALSEAENKAMPHGIAPNAYELAAAQIELGRFAEAAHNLDKARELWEQLNNPYELSKTYICLAYLCVRQGQNQQSVLYLEKVETLRSQLSRIELQASLVPYIDYVNQLIGA